MLSLIIWWMGLILEFAILARGLRTRAITKYPYFYVYIFCVFGVSLGLYAAYRVSPSLYGQWYWRTQFVTLLVGCGVILEILERILESYAGARRFLRALCLGILAAVIGYAALKVALGAVRLNPVTFAGMERDLRAVQAVFLATILLVVFYYAIHLDRNAKGLILGFGVYVGVSLMTLAVVAVFDERFQNVTGFLQSASYLFALGVWTIALWSYAPHAIPERGQSEPDYEELANDTRERLEALRNQFDRTARP